MNQLIIKMTTNTRSGRTTHTQIPKHNRDTRWSLSEAVPASEIKTPRRVRSNLCNQLEGVERRPVQRMFKGLFGKKGDAVHGPGGPKGGNSNMSKTAQRRLARGVDCNSE